MGFLELNCTLYVAWLIWALKKENRFTIYSFLILFYMSLAVIGVYSVRTGIYFETFGYYSENKLELIPYINAFITYFVLLLPFYNIRCNIKDVNYIFCSQTKKIIFIWIVVYVCFTILKLTEAITSVSLGLASAYENRHNEGMTLFEYTGLLAKFNGYSSFFLKASTPFVMLYSLFGIKTKRVSLKLASLLITLCFLPSFLDSLGMGSRGSMFMTFFCFLFFVFILQEQLTKKFKRIVVIFSISLATLVLVYSWAITIDRVDAFSGFDSIIRYFGESFPNLGWTIWDNATAHPMGDRFYPEFFRPDVTTYSVSDAYSYWQMITGVPVLNFKTYYGDLYVEFGQYGALLFLALTSIPVWFYYKKHGVTVLNFAYLYFYYQICVFAFSGFTKTGWHSIFELIIITIFTIYLKILYAKKVNR